MELLVAKPDQVGQRGRVSIPVARHRDFSAMQFSRILLGQNDSREKKQQEKGQQFLHCSMPVCSV
jgi:hypothetical protein